jgi:plasmid stabilization system protein ParE
VIRLHISPPASAELTEAVRWYEQQRAGLGAELLDAVASATDLIRTRPALGSPRGRTRSLLISRFPFRLVYRVQEHHIHIVAIAHTSRRPDYWKDRE